MAEPCLTADRVCLRDSPFAGGTSTLYKESRKIEGVGYMLCSVENRGSEFVFKAYDPKTSVTMRTTVPKAKVDTVLEQKPNLKSSDKHLFKYFCNLLTVVEGNLIVSGK